MPFVYSERFILATALGHSTPFVVPAGKRAVVKSISADNSETVAAAVVLYLGALPVWAALLQASSAIAIGGQMVVAYQGESIDIWLSQNNCHAQASGFLLEASSAGALQESQQIPPDDPWDLDTRWLRGPPAA